jgi:predicted small integral membrane protein
MGAGLSAPSETWPPAYRAIGGEWFGMWQSSVWNGEQSAFRFHMTIVAVLIYLVLPEPDGLPGD